MVKIVYLQPGEEPPWSERRLVIEWSRSGGTSYSRFRRQLHVRVGPESHRFWSREASILARRMKVEEMFFINSPILQPAPAPARAKRPDPGSERIRPCD